MSISLLEAMAAGKPIITTTIASNLEVTRKGEGALLVPPKAPVELADAIKTIATNPACRTRLARRAKEIQRDRYTMERMVEAYMMQYSELLREKGIKAQS
jgi:glycosyltransferase involved in cell wall biosynthesis